MVDAPVCFRNENWRTWFESISLEKSGGPPITDCQKKVKPRYEEVVAWYKTYVLSVPVDAVPPERSEEERAASEHFGLPGLRKMVRKAREEFAPAYWKKTGNKNRKRAKMAK
jgi:hypothetical protein